MKTKTVNQTTSITREQRDWKKKRMHHVSSKIFALSIILLLGLSISRFTYGQNSTSAIDSVKTITDSRTPLLLGEVEPSPTTPNYWSANGINIYNNNTGFVGIGTSNPTNKLHVYTSRQNNYAAVIENQDAYGKGLLIESTYPGVSPLNPILTVQTVENTVRFIVLANGNVGIGTTTPGSFKLAVEGKIGAREIVVQSTAWADFVFDKNYKLLPLADLDEFISVNGHLPEVPTASEVEQQGVNLGEMQSILLQKIEELTLYMIDQDKKMNALIKENEVLQEQISIISKK